MKQETLEEVAERLYPIILEEGVWDKNKQYRDVWMNGAKYQQQQDTNKYSKEDIEEYAEYCTTHVLTTQIGNPYLSIKEWFEQFKKK